MNQEVPRVISKGFYKTYRFYAFKILSYLQKQSLFKAAKVRHGVEGVRILRMILINGRLEQRTIQDLALMTAKDVRKILYKLLHEGLLSLQEISKNNNPMFTYYLWY